jgi:hypothetical protein
MASDSRGLTGREPMAMTNLLQLYLESCVGRCADRPIGKVPSPNYRVLHRVSMFGWQRGEPQCRGIRSRTAPGHDPARLLR